MRLQLILIFIALTITSCESTNSNFMGTLDSVTNSINTALESVESSVNGAANAMVSSSKEDHTVSEDEMHGLLGQINPNTTTSQEVKNLLGEPQSKSRANGRIIWHYTNADVEFNSKGVVTTTKLI